MGIITTIKHLFKNSRNPLPDDVFEDTNDIDAEREHEENLTKYFYNKTKEDAQRYDPALIPIRKEYSRQKPYRIKFHFIPKEQNNKNVRSYIQYTFNHWQNGRIYAYTTLKTQSYLPVLPKYL